jgi:sugar/nucleoside kinase (ribokinase family)
VTDPDIDQQGAGRRRCPDGVREFEGHGPRGGVESEAVDSLLPAGVREVGVKRGARGATGFTADGASDCAARRVDVVDLVGAGDAFVADTCPDS